MSYHPPSSGGARPGSSAGRGGGAKATGPGTGSGRPPGTATRLTTGMAPGTGRPGSRGGVTGGGVALNAQLTVTDRPMTQQGLGGMRTAQRGPHRQVQDKTYFVGLLRSKVADLTAEVGRLTKEADASSEDQASYLTYEKRAEVLASEIRDLQGELGDYNTLVDKLNTDESIGDIQMDCEELRAQNDREEKALDTYFEQKQTRETNIHQLDIELQQEKSMTDNMVAGMDNDMKQKYMKLKDVNEHLLKQLESGQQQLDSFSLKKLELEEELTMSPVKQEAVRLYEQLHELEEKQAQLLQEAQSRGTPQEEREKLLRQVKEDNQEIASMERQSTEIQEKVLAMQDEIRQLDMDIEENQGERNQKFRELKKREEMMNEFMDNFEDNKAQDQERIGQFEANIVLVLEHMSRNLARFHHLPTPQELSGMKDDLNFKETEMHKSENTASGLASESEKLHGDLQKVEQLESKITQELDQLRSRIDTMTTELETYSDLDRLREEAEQKKKKLAEDKVTLYKRRETFKKVIQQLTSQYEALKAQLNDNETYAQLGNLERKWQHHEQNNFVMKEFIAAKSMECDYQQTSKVVSGMIEEYNQCLQDMISGRASMA